VRVGVLLLTGRLVLAGVLLVAAVAKLTDRAGARRSLEAFGVPAALVPAAAVALPVAELLVGVALVPVTTAWAAALAATALLVSFSAAIALAIRRGVEADCHCFGRLSSEHVGRGTLARNLALLVPAVFVAVAAEGDAGTSATAWLGDLSTVAALGLAGAALLSAALAVNFAFLFQLLKQNGRLWTEIEKLRGGASAPPLDSPAPRLALPDLSGRLVELDDLLDGERGLLLVFSDPHCAAGSGRIVNVSTTMGSLSDASDPESPYYDVVVPAYQASKASLNAITVALAKLLRDSSIKVNSICPGWVQTDLGGPDNRAAAPHTAEEAAPIIVEMASMPDDGPSGQFVDRHGPIAW